MFSRIVSDAAVLRGKPRIRGTRITVEFVLELMASGACREDILASYPHLTTEDLEEAVRYAAQFLSNEIMLTAEVAA
jgi:uncharacterized protein (DUF433 family)